MELQKKIAPKGKGSNETVHLPPPFQGSLLSFASESTQQTCTLYDLWRQNANLNTVLWFSFRLARNITVLKMMTKDIDPAEIGKQAHYIQSKLFLQYSWFAALVDLVLSRCVFLLSRLPFPPLDNIKKLHSNPYVCRSLGSLQTSFLIFYCISLKIQPLLQFWLKASWKSSNPCFPGKWFLKMFFNPFIMKSWRNIDFRMNFAKSRSRNRRACQDPSHNTDSPDDSRITKILN